MATQLFLRSDASGSQTSFGPSVGMATTRGAALKAGIVDSSAGGDHIPWQIYCGSGALRPVAGFAYVVNAVTISGTITVNIWANEVAMTDNCQMAVIISRYDRDGVFISDVVAQANANHASGSELGTSSSANNWTVTPTATTFNDGDILFVYFHIDAIGTMAGNIGLNLSFNGATAAANGDSYITFTETITAYSPPVTVGATKLFLLDASSSMGPNDTVIPYTYQRSGGTVRGAGVVNWPTTMTASGNHIKSILSNSGGGVGCYCYQSLAHVRISGTITVNVWAFESAATVNGQMAVIISRYNNQGFWISDIAAQANANHARGTEMATSSGVNNWTVTPTATDIYQGDFVVIGFHYDAIGTMAAGTASLLWAGATNAASGDSYVTFTENLVTQAPLAATYVPYRRLNPAILAQ